MRPASGYERATGNQTHISKACCCYTNYQRPLRAERAVDDLLALLSACSSAGKCLLVFVSPGIRKAQRESTRLPTKSTRNPRPCRLPRRHQGLPERGGPTPHCLRRWESTTSRTLRPLLKQKTTRETRDNFNGDPRGLDLFKTRPFHRIAKNVSGMSRVNVLWEQQGRTSRLRITR